MKQWKWLFCGILCCLSILGAAEQAGTTCCSLCWHPARVNVSGYLGEGMGLDTRRATVSGFIAPQLNLEWHPFLDLRGHYLSHGHWAANAGLGMRWLQPCSENIWGTYLFYDYREGRDGHFHQIGPGLEYLGSCFDVRLNGYFPVGSHTHSRKHLFDDYIGPFRMTCREFERAKGGANLELGLPIYRCGLLEFYGALGTYYYHHRDSANFWGGSARFLFRYTEYFSVEARVTYDRDFHTKAQGIFTLTLPFDLFNDCGCGNCLLWQPVVRNDVIILNHRNCCWTKNF
ncbi:MAG: inverse autotransporter beta domain-containing protein [Parachlamydia sp.]|nr:inverse autotransporter beta domain-containing protein [Parachlamydia sp.]